MTVNILIMIHGMIPDAKPTSHTKEYEQFWQELKDKQSQLSSLFPDGYIGVEWGCEPPSMDNIPTEQLRDDEKITRAQNFINLNIGKKNRLLKKQQNYFWKTRKNYLRLVDSSTLKLQPEESDRSTFSPTLLKSLLLVFSPSPTSPPALATAWEYNETF